MATLELAKFTLKPESEAPFLAANRRAMEQVQRFPGFIRGEVGRLDDSTWVFIGLWETREAAETGMEKAQALPEFGEAAALMDEIVLYEHAQVADTFA
jgi:hypothetical protein